MARPVHFEIPSDNPEKAIEFYKTVFGWKIEKWDGPMPYWNVTTGADPEPGINGGIMPRQHPNQPCVNTIGVENLDETSSKILAAGGKSALPKMAIPGVGWLAYFLDLDGHVFGCMQMDPNAK